MSQNKLDAAADPQRFAEAAKSILWADNYSPQTKRDWVTQHVADIMAYQAEGGELLVTHLAALEVLRAGLAHIDKLEAAEAARQRAIVAQADREQHRLQRLAEVEAWQESLRTQAAQRAAVRRQIQTARAIDKSLAEVVRPLLGGRWYKLASNLTSIPAFNEVGLA